MGKTIGIIAAIVIVVVAVFIVIGFTGNSGSDSKNNTNGETESNLNSGFLEENVNEEIENVNSASSGNENATVNTSEEEGGVEKDVTVTDSGFSPATLTIKAGDSVTWTNERSQTVYVAPDNHPDHQKYSGVWDDDGTGQIETDESYTMTFTDAGTYTYHDHLDSSRAGTIIVTE